jgi:hypothetical protein
MFDLDYELFKIYKPKADKVIERVKIEKRVAIPGAVEEYEWINLNVMQQYLQDICIKNGWHIEKLGGNNEYEFCVVNIYSC